MKQLSLFLIIALFVSFPVTIMSAQTDLKYYTFGWQNCSMYGGINELVDELITTGSVLVEVNPFLSVSEPNISQPSLGIGLFFVHIARNHSIEISDFSIILNDEPAIEMLINYTYIDGLYQPDPYSPIYETKYLLFYTYLFANHSIYNEQKILPAIGPIHLRNETEPLGSYLLSQGFKVSDDAHKDDIELIVSIADDTTTTSTSTSDIITSRPVITDMTAIGITISVVIICVVILLYRRRLKHRHSV
jgi:hypothetical protein